MAKKKPAPVAGTVTFDKRSKPSYALSSDTTRPILTYGYLREVEGAWCLQVTDSYCAVQIPVHVDGGGAVEGFVPGDALKQIERLPSRAFTANGRVEIDEARVSYDRAFPGEYPNVHQLRADMKDPVCVWLDAKLLLRLARAIGCEDDGKQAVGLEIDRDGFNEKGIYLRPIRVKPGNLNNEGEGLLMPIRPRNP